MGKLISRGKASEAVLLRLVLIALVAVLAIAIAGCATSVQVSVRNNTGSAVSVTACVDDTVNVAAGQTFHASGVPQDNQLLCLLIHNEESEQCIAILDPERIDGTYLLSRAAKVSMSRCP
jgi:hypothetical protein